MPKPSEVVPCVDCQRLYTKKQLNRMGRCPDCASHAVRDAIVQLHAHSGPYYEKWKRAVLEQALNMKTE